MYSVTKIFQVPMGHRLSKHKGKCKNIHGHNLKIEVTISSKKLDDNNMVMDFSDLKKVVSAIIESWDHGLFLNCEDVILKKAHIQDGLDTDPMRVHTFDGDPTAEVLCTFLYTQINNFIIGLDSKNGLQVDQISIWEAEDSKATYYG